jgi:ElaA protein
MDLIWKKWSELALDEFHAAARLRERVFVVEQQCVYADLDGKDPLAEHLLAGPCAQLGGYLRILPPGSRFETDFSIGRVVVAPEARRAGLARQMMVAAIDRIRQVHGADAPIRISAQAYLETFYRSLGFETVHGPYDEDGIPHYEMRLAR